MNRIWRRRRCTSCLAVFTTTETVELGQCLIVASDGSETALAPFSPEKLLISLYESCRHRPTAVSDASALAGTIQAQILTLAQNGIINRHTLLNLVTRTLRRFDQTAAVYYQAYYASD